MHHAHLPLLIPTWTGERRGPSYYVAHRGRVHQANTSSLRHWQTGRFRGESSLYYPSLEENTLLFPKFLL